MVVLVGIFCGRGCENEWFQTLSQEALEGP